jgi:phosphoribosylaminoimidazole-succinocarboxamide synthase
MNLNSEDSSSLHTSTLASLPLLARGKVRDNYVVGDNCILMIASDRISAFDVIMGEPIPNKGKILTKMTLFWFNLLGDRFCPNHLTHQDPQDVVNEWERSIIADRAMLVKRLTPLPIEAVVRGYLTGGGWKDYQLTGKVCGITLPAGLKNACKLPSIIYTPAAKAPSGEHDENISFEDTCALIGPHLAEKIRTISIALYQFAAEYALGKGIIIADTKFEFGLDEHGTLTLMDEVLTPDSSRYWPIESYVAGTNPESFDKQFLRDWLETIRINAKPWDKTAPAPRLPDDIIASTSKKYQEALERLITK